MTFGSGTGIAGFSDAFTMIFLNALGVAQGRVIIKIQDKFFNF